MKLAIATMLKEALSVQKTLGETKVEKMTSAVEMIEACFRAGGKLLICGNGGSAADSQHLAAEFVSRFLIERRALPAIALNTNNSSMTAISNDYGYEFSFSRQVEAFGKSGDVLWAISTSGNSKNVLRACDAARHLGIQVIGMTGESGGEMKGLCDLLLNAPSGHTPRIQECHILMGHVICELVEARMFGK
jgi:D-sedoheptulose 7-phosphate isomerase